MKYLSQLVSRAEVQDADTVVGYRSATVGGSARWTWSAVKTWILSWLQTSNVGVRHAITSYAELAAIATTAITPGATGSAVLWIDTGGRFHASQLRLSTETTDTAEGRQRPDDYAATTNEKVWFDCV